MNDYLEQLVEFIRKSFIISNGQFLPTVFVSVDDSSTDSRDIELSLLHTSKKYISRMYLVPVTIPEPESYVFVTSLESLAQKDALSDFLKDLAKIPQVKQIVLTIESWLSQLKADDPLVKKLQAGEISVSDLPDSKKSEGVIMLSMTRELQKVYQLPIIRTTQGPRLSPPEEFPNSDMFAGRFCNVFSVQPEKVN